MRTLHRPSSPIFAVLGVLMVALAVLVSSASQAQSAINAPPKFPGDSIARYVPENSLPGTSVGDPVAAKDDDDDSLTYSIAGADANLFVIKSATGQIQVAEETVLDYEGKTSYAVTVTAVDPSGASASIAVTIRVIDMTLGTSYDRDNNEIIDRDEAVAAVADYFGGVINRDEALRVIQLYFSPTPVPAAGGLRWSFETDSVVHSSPEISDGILYVASEGGYLYALDARNGKRLWRFRVGVSESSPEVADGIVYVGSWDSYVYALDSATGHLLWRYETGGEVNSSPAAAEGVVCFGSNDGYIYTLDAKTGELLWRYETGDQVRSSPALSNGVAYVGSKNGNVYALDLLSGALVWHYESGAYVTSSPTVTGGIVYIGSGAHDTYALDALTGNLVWSHQTEYWIISSPTVVDGTAYILSLRYVYALDARTGELSWRHGLDDWFLPSAAAADGVLYVSGAVSGFTHALDASDGLRLHSYPESGFGAPKVSDGVIYIGSEGGVYAYDAMVAHPQGNPPWRFQTDGETLSYPAVVEGVVYVSSESGYVYALEAWTGQFLWRQEIDSRINPFPVVFGDVVYIGARDGFIHALEAATGKQLWEFEADSGIDSLPRVSGGVVYVASDRGSIYALEALTGTLLWQYRIDLYGPSALVSYLEVNGGVVYVGSFSYSSSGHSSLVALEASSGDRIWQYNIPNGRILTAALASGAVYVGASDGHVYALRTSEGDLLWQFPAESATDVKLHQFYSLTVDGGVVYAASENGMVYALDASNGIKMWEYEAGGDVYASPMVVDGTVYIESQPNYSVQSSYVHAVQVSTGKLLWRYEVGYVRFFSSVTEEDGRVYIGSEDGSVSVLNASDGESFWRYELGHIDPLYPHLGVERRISVPWVVDGVVYVGSDDGSVYALDTNAMPIPAPSRFPSYPEPAYPVGELLWSFRFPSNEKTSSNPTVADDVVYITLLDNSVRALDAVTGEALWSYQVGGWIYSSPVVVGDILYVSSRDRYVYALDASTGTLVWRYETGHNIFYRLAVFDNVVYAESGAHVYALEALTGDLLWTAEIEVGVSFSPILAGEMLYIGSLAGYLYALDASTGGEIWRHKVDEESYYVSAGGGKVYDSVFTVPTVVRDTVYIGTDSGHVKALNASSGELIWQYETSSSVWLTPLVDAGILYAGGSFGGRLHALDASSGELIWQYKPGDGVFSLAVSDGLVYVDSDQIYALDALTGEPRWRAPGEPLFRPMVNDGVIHATYEAHTKDGFVRGVSALDTETGATVWRYHMDVGLGRPATFADGVLYVTPTENYYDSERRDYTGYYLHAVTGPRVR